MNSEYDLPLAFFKKDAFSAGRVLASMSPDDAARFLSTVPAQLAAPAIAGIKPHSAAQILQAMNVESAAALVNMLGFARAAGIVRQIAPHMRKIILSRLPRTVQRNFELALNFPTDMVGSYMSTAVILMGADDQVSEALEFIRQPNIESSDAVFVVDQTQQFVGAVSLSNLLRFDSQTPLAELLDTSCVTLSAYANLETVSGLDIWHDYSQLPVVNRRHQVIGVLERKALRPEVSGVTGDRQFIPPGLTKSLTDALTVSVVGLTRLLIPSGGDTQVSGDDHGR